jgi:hypothetical protein
MNAVIALFAAEFDFYQTLILLIMKITIMPLAYALLLFMSHSASAQTVKADKQAAKKHLFIDVHQLTPGKVTFADVAGAHSKDVATQGKHGVKFIKYWVNEEKGLVYCLASAPDSATIRDTHAEAHGLLPQSIFGVTDGQVAKAKANRDYFLDIHYLGAGKVTAKDVAGAHQKDLAAEGKHGVNFINYWVDEKNGVVLCLSQAKKPEAIVSTHREAHGLLPAAVLKVKQGE